MCAVIHQCELHLADSVYDNMVPSIANVWLATLPAHSVLSSLELRMGETSNSLGCQKPSTRCDRYKRTEINELPTPSLDSHDSHAALPMRRSTPAASPSHTRRHRSRSRARSNRGGCGIRFLSVGSCSSASRGALRHLHVRWVVRHVRFVRPVVGAVAAEVVQEHAHAIKRRGEGRHARARKALYRNVLPRGRAHVRRTGPRLRAVARGEPALRHARHRVPPPWCQSPARGGSPRGPQLAQRVSRRRGRQGRG